MKHKLSLFLAIIMACSTLGTTAMAAESDITAQEEQTQEEVVVEPDPEGTVSWKNLRGRIQNGSLSLRSLTENINSIESLDYDQMKENLRKQLNSIAKAQWAITNAGGDSSSLDSAYDSLRDTFDEIVDGDMQEDNAELVCQLQNASNQIAAAGESLYITLAGLEQSAQDIQRGIDSIDRSLDDARTRLHLGQASQQMVKNLEQSRSELVSQLNTLNANITTYKMQLQTMIGESPTGELTLIGVPDEEDEEWTAPDYEADLAAAKSASYTLRDAQSTLEDEREDWKDARTDYSNKPTKKYLLEMAEHTWNSAQLTYESTVQEFETSFKKLYDSLADYEQVLENKKSTLDYQKEQLTITEKKYELGRASRYDVLTAQDNVASAQSAVDSAWRDLFSARNSYQWAVEYGLL